MPFDPELYILNPIQLYTPILNPLPFCRLGCIVEILHIPMFVGTEDQKWWVLVVLLSAARILAPAVGHQLVFFFTVQMLFYRAQGVIATYKSAHSLCSYFTNR